ncbi:hypothetical protein KL941_005420, partial [Ogataea angusta]
LKKRLGNTLRNYFGRSRCNDYGSLFAGDFTDLRSWYASYLQLPERAGTGKEPATSIPAPFMRKMARHGSIVAIKYIHLFHLDLRRFTGM